MFVYGDSAILEIFIQNVTIHEYEWIYVKGSSSY